MDKLTEKLTPKKPINQQGIPLWGYCPKCGKAVTKYANPVCCKECMQILKWD